MAGIPIDSGRMALRGKASRLTQRAHLIREIRRFFWDRDYLEVETPVRLVTPATEEHIDAISCGGGFLRTSPELHMKRMVAAGYGKIFQLGPCFRCDEQGKIHHPEFTLLEWYCAEAGYIEVLAETKAMLLHLAESMFGSPELLYHGERIDLVPWERWVVRDAFILHAGWDPVADYDPDRFDVDLVDRVEPAMPPDLPTVLMDYPVAAGALARAKPEEPKVAERWELYLGGMELANAYSELNDPDEQRVRMELWAGRRQARGQPVYPMDEAFLRDLAHLPRAGGVALGIDRLVMLFTDAESLDQVIPFREAPIPR